MLWHVMHPKKCFHFTYDGTMPGGDFHILHKYSQLTFVLCSLNTEIVRIVSSTVASLQRDWKGSL
jgi:hypothetical protein